MHETQHDKPAMFWTHTVSTTSTTGWTQYDNMSFWFTPWVQFQPPVETHVNTADMKGIPSPIAKNVNTVPKATWGGKAKISNCVSNRLTLPGKTEWPSTGHRPIEENARRETFNTARYRIYPDPCSGWQARQTFLNAACWKTVRAVVGWLHRIGEPSPPMHWSWTIWKQMRGEVTQISPVS